MSGGSLDYAYQMLNDIIDRAQWRKLDKVQKAFIEHLKKVADALHDMEWVLSADYGGGDDHKAILKCITVNDVLNNQIAEAKLLLMDLQATIDTNKDWGKINESNT